MIRRFLISLLVLILVLAGGFVAFYFWAQQPQLDPSEYYLERKYTQSAPPKDTLTVITYNIGYLSGMKNNLAEEMPPGLFRSGLAELVKFLKSTDPDIVGFQEIDFGASRSYYQNQLDSLAILAGYSNAYQSINWDRTYVPFPYWPPQYHFGEILSGQAIMSKYELNNSSTEVLIKPVTAPFYYNAFYLDRLVQITNVRIGESVIKVMNLHLEAFDQETRVLQAERVRELYDSLSGEYPVILMGDFNSVPAIEDVNDAMTYFLGKGIASAIGDVRYAAAPMSHYTFSSGDPYQMIDYILFDPTKIELISSRVCIEAGQISDHLPVEMKFVLKTANDTTILE